ncbi:hypothetical protein JCM11641_000346 [Rhodosporidiobolus odoratus]
MIIAPSFRTSRLSFRATQPEDVALFSRMFSDEATLFGCTAAPCTPWSNKSAESFMKFCGEATMSLVFYLDPDSENTDVKEEAVGWIVLDEEFKGGPHQRASSGISLMKEYQGKGYGKEAMEFMLETAFLRYNFHRVECDVYAWNEPALRLYKSVGFVEEGRRRKSLFQQGEWRDEYLLAILQTDWRAAHTDRLQLEQP